MTYRRLNILVATVIAGYFLVGNLTRLIGYGEIFPITSWDLFSFVPEPQGADYSLRILAVNGATLDQPLYFEHAEHLFAKAHSIDANSVISALGDAVTTGDDAAISASRTLLEPVFLGDAAEVRYAVVRRTYNLLDRWNHNVFKTETAIAVFDTAARR